MATREPIRVGILGLGRAGWGMVSRELQAHPRQYKVVAACDLIKARRDRMVEVFGCTAYRRAEDLIGDPNVELLVVATRSCDHCAHAVAGLKAGKLVFVEKPMCATHAEARKLQAADARYKGSLYVRHNRRFEAGFQHIRELIDSGLLGEVFEIKLRRNSYGRRDDWQTIKKFGGGQLLNWGPHIIDHSLQLLGAPPASIWSDLKCVAAVGDAEDHLKIVFRGENGRLVDMEISGGSAIGEPNYIVSGSKGGLTSTGNEIQLRYLDPKHKLTVRRPKAGTPKEGFGSSDNLKWIEKTVKVKAVKGGDIWDALFKAIRGGEPFPITLDQAVAVMKVVSHVKKGTAFA